MLLLLVRVPPVVPVAPRDPQTLSSWDRLWPLLVTAALSLAVVLVVQLYVVPHVESRKRREDRWEGDLRRLGEATAFDLTEAADEYASAVSVSHLLAALAPDTHAVDNERHRQATRDVDDRRRNAYDRFRRAQTQVRYMADQVCSIAPHHPGSRRLQLAVIRVQMMDLTRVDPTYTPDGGPIDSAQVEEAIKALRGGIGGLLESIEALGSGKRPRRATPMRRALEAMMRRLRALRD